MKNIISKLSVILFFAGVLAGCEEDLVVYDVENGESFASFQSAADPLIFNPVAETENIYTVGVSTRSSVDRQVVISVDTSSTLDPSFYNIETLNPIIPAGELSTDIIITTPANTTFPSAGSNLILNLESVEGAVIKSFNLDTQNIGFAVECPTVDLTNIPGTYTVASDDFEFILHNTFEIEAGPGDGEFTIVNLSGHPNPESNGEQNYDVVFTVDPETGAVSVDRQAAWHFDNFGGDPDYGVGSVEGTGLVLTCINQINFNLTHTVSAGSFGKYSLQIVKQ